MTNKDRDTTGPGLMSTHSLLGKSVHSPFGEHLGDIKDFMLDARSGKVSFVVLSVGGVFTLGEKLFAVPWQALSIDPEKKRFVLNVEKDQFEDAPSFDASHWPNMADPAWAEEIHAYYDTPAS